MLDTPRLSRLTVSLALLCLLLALAAGCAPKSQPSSPPSPTLAQNASPTDQSPATAGSASDIVHATATGKRYHRAGCSSLAKSDTTMTRAEAEAKGLTSCKICKP